MPRLVIVVMMFVLVVPQVARAGDPEIPAEDEALYHCKNKTGQVAVTFKPETDLKDLVTWAMGFTCKNFMFDPTYVQRGKKVTVIAPNTMSAAEAYRVFLAALSTIGLTVVPKGNILRIVESSTARAETVPIYKHGLPDDQEQVVRYVLRPTYAQPQTLQLALTSMKSAAGEITAVGTILMITDYAATVRDMMTVVKLVDVPGGTDGLYTIPVKHADADKLAKELESLLAMTAMTEKGAPAAAPSKLLVDSRTNTLIVAANEAAYQRVRGLVERIDIPVETENGGTMHVYPLKAAIAEEVAKVVNESITGQVKPNAATAGKPGGAATTPGGDVVHLEGEAHVIADKATNKLIVMSSGRDFIALKGIIAELDEPRKQVYIEATILEVALDNGFTFGISEHATAQNSKTGAVTVGGVQTPQLSSTNIATLTAASGLLGGWIGPAVKASTLLGTSFPSYGLLFQALGTSANTEILSAPSIIALDNEEAKYKVGTNIPIIKGTVPVSATNPTTLTTTNVDREPLDLELDIKPHISSGDTVLLEVKHSNKDLISDDARLGPTWSTREIETRVVVKDQQTVVIGGLMQEKEIKNVTGVPILGDIPILGYLFRYTTKTKKKTNLLVLLTPYIVKDQMDLENIRARRMRQQDEFLRSLKSLEGMKLNPEVDYRRKRGLVEEINRSIEDVEEETEARAQLATPTGVIPGPVAPKSDEH